MLKVRGRKSESDTRYDMRDYDSYYTDRAYDAVDYDNEYSYSTSYDDNFDLDLAYEDYGMYDEEPRYVEPYEEPRYSSFRSSYSDDMSKKHQAPRRKKKGMSASMKALVVVYFAIVAVIATLLILNALPMMNANNAELSVQGMENVEHVEVDANAINNVTLASGTIATITVNETAPYEYKINSNWFDNMCDWMENIAA